MRRFALALLPLAALIAGCTSTDYDLMKTAAVSSKFKDNDPQDFGARSPHRHPIHGIDVSKYNERVDWETAKKSGVSFAFIKATEGKDRIDPKFDEFWRGARAANVAYAPYHFYYFCSTPDQQADWFIANVPREAVKLPPVLDAEWNPASPTCKLRPDPATVRADMKRFMDRLQAHYGKRPIIYTSVDFHRDNFVGYFKDYQFWLRSVASHPEEKYADRKWAFWQYTSTGVVPGVSGQTDINVFAGTQDNWKSWLAYADAR